MLQIIKQFFRNPQIKTTIRGIKQIFWPIKKRELKKFLPLSLLMFGILFVNSSLRVLKDSLVIPLAGAEIVQFIKLSCVLPMAILSTFIYTKLIHQIHYEKVFYIIASGFITIFLLIAFVLLPNQAALEPHPDTITTLVQAYPYLQWWIKIYGHWTMVFTYVVAELWNSLMFNLLFWHFANHINTTKEASKSYVIIGLIGNSALIAGGSTMQFISSISFRAVELWPTPISAMQAMVSITLVTILFMCGFILAIYRWMNVVVVPDPRYVSPKKVYENIKIKPQSSWWSSFRTIVRSPYLGLIALLLLSYGVCIGLAEGVWRSKLEQAFPDHNELANFMGLYQTYIGIASIVFTIVGSNIVRMLPWRFAASVTPLMFLITGIAFFSFCVFDNTISAAFGLAASNTLEIAVYLGTLQIILSKSSKYTIFDASKEMAYIPLSYELKTKGKAAVDVVGPHAGKSLSALVQALLIVAFPVGGYVAITPYLATIFISCTIVWLVAVSRLSRHYETMIIEHEELEEQHNG